MSVLYITHDLGVISEIADDVVVMYLGRIVERAPKRELFKNPMHPYTKRLMRSIPRPSDTADRLEVIPGTVPVPIGLPDECGFGSRCEERGDRCSGGQPEMSEVSAGHFVRCCECGSPVKERS